MSDAWRMERWRASEEAIAKREAERRADKAEIERLRAELAASLYWPTVCDIIGCAVRHDDEGVRNYAELLASNLEKDGRIPAANAVRRRLRGGGDGETLYLTAIPAAGESLE